MYFYVIWLKVAWFCESRIIMEKYDNAERTKQMEEILNFQKPSEGLELVILLHTQY